MIHDGPAGLETIGSAPLAQEEDGFTVFPRSLVGGRYQELRHQAPSLTDPFRNIAAILAKTPLHDASTCDERKGPATPSPSDARALPQNRTREKTKLGGGPVDDDPIPGERNVHRSHSVAITSNSVFGTRLRVAPPIPGEGGGPG